MAGHHWHHLQLIDNLESDKNCRLCGKSVLGSRGYKCGDYNWCHFIIHESCPIDHKIEGSHDQWNPHHLISMKIEEEKNGDEKKVVVCSLCEEPVSSLLMLGNNNLNNNGPSSYKCSFPNCTFLIHQPCALLPYQIPKHPLHITHRYLFLREPTETQNRCGACIKVFSKRFYYECITCDYMLHITCDSRWRNISANKCNPHAFIPIPDPIEFTCQVCGVKGSDFACHCSNCLILIHYCWELTQIINKCEDNCWII